jgi:hypothetical protein
MSNNNELLYAMLKNEDFREMEYSALLDMLSHETQKYTNAMRFSVADPALKVHEKRMKSLMDEIEYRRKTGETPSSKNVQHPVPSENGKD